MIRLIWKHWSISDLQKELEKVDKKLLEDLEIVIPKIVGNRYDPTILYSKKNLVKILLAFSSANYFQNKRNMKKCLNRLPNKELKKLIEDLNLKPNNSFEGNVKKILSYNWEDLDFSKKFLIHFSLPMHFLPPEPWNPPSCIKFTPPSSDNPIEITNVYLPLLDFQFEVYLEAMKQMEIPRSRFFIQMPTGSGKTRTAMQIITKYINEKTDNGIVIWLAHSEELCEQSFECFDEVWNHIGRKELRAFRFWGKHEFPTPFATPIFLVAGFQKLYSMIKKDEKVFNSIKSRIELIVVDEAHKVVAPTYKKVIKKLTGSKTKIFGLSATPGRSNLDEITELTNVFFNKKIDIPTKNNISVVKKLRNERIMSKIKREPLITRLTFTLSKKEIKRVEQFFDYPEGFLKRVGSNNLRNIEIVKRILSECENGKKILFFSCNVKHSKFITALLIYFGIDSAHIDGSTNKNLRRNYIEKFKKGKIQVLSNFGVLSTGFDAPNTDVVFISRPTASVVLYSQMIGRGLRGPKIGGTKECKIVDVIDNIEGFGGQDRVYSYFEDYWNN